MTLDTIYVMDRNDPMPQPNKKYLRLYGHTLCPFVERVRMVLAGFDYQDCQVNLERRTKWHYYLNNGFVPILETPIDNPVFGKHFIIFESRNIMDFLNDHLSLGLYAKDTFEKASQLQLMALVDAIPGQLLRITLTKGQDNQAITDLIAVFEKLEVKLWNQKYLSGDTIQMCDMYTFPHVSRLFYMKDSKLNQVYERLRLETKFPHLCGWFNRIRAESKYGLIPPKAFHYWLDELMQVPMGTKPALRLPMKL